MDRDKLGLLLPSEGGVSQSGTTLAAGSAELTVLEAGRVREACERLIAAKQTYRSLLYLNRARLEDVPALFAASHSADLEERWKRLWVLAPFLSRVARHRLGARAIADELRRDLSALQLFVKLVDADNLSADRLLERAHDEILPLVLERVLALRSDPRRLPTAVTLLAAIERREPMLREALSAQLDEAALATLWPSLVLDREEDKQLSATGLRDKLLALDPKAKAP